MQLLIIVPRQPITTGNYITAKRFAAQLPEHGWQCTLIETAPDSARHIDAALKNLSPDAILLLHAYSSGRPWLLSQAAQQIPTAVLMTGTDYNHDLLIPERAATISQVHHQAAAIIYQNLLISQQLSRELGGDGLKLHVLPPGIRLGHQSFPLRDTLQLDSHAPLFLHPAGLRPVKGNLELLLMCDQLVEQHPDFALAFCGPPLDEDYTQAFFTALTDRPWAHYLGEIPKAAMADSMRQADVILNNSKSEGVANALVEAVALGRPILAQNIVGNRAIVKHGQNGLLYMGQEQFHKHARQLIRDLSFRAQLSKPNPAKYSPEREGQLLAAILKQMLVEDNSHD